MTSKFLNTAIQIVVVVSQSDCIQTITNANGQPPCLCSVKLSYGWKGGFLLCGQGDVVICDGNYRNPTFNGTA